MPILVRLTQALGPTYCKATAMFVMESIDDLWDHIAYVLAYAPNDFPYEDFLPADQQMTLDLAFGQLREGVQLAYPAQADEVKRRDLYAILDRSYAAYQIPDDVAAGNLLNEFQDRIFKST